MRHRRLEQRRNRPLPLPVAAAGAPCRVHPLSRRHEPGRELHGVEGIWTHEMDRPVQLPRPCSADQAFWTSIRNTAILVCYIPLSVAITVFVSALLREGLRGWQVYRAILYIPNLLGLVIIGVVFSIYLRDDGPLNLALKWAGGSTVRFMTSPWLALNSIAIIKVVWVHLGFGLIYFLAAMNGIEPGSLRGGDHRRRGLLPDVLARHRAEHPLCHRVLGGVQLHRGVRPHVQPHLHPHPGRTRICHVHPGVRDLRPGIREVPRRVLQRVVHGPVPLLRRHFRRADPPDAAEERMRKASSIGAGWRVLVQVFLIALVVASLLPLYNVIAASFKSADEFVMNPFFPPQVAHYGQLRLRRRQRAAAALRGQQPHPRAAGSAAVPGGMHLGGLRVRQDAIPPQAAPVPPRALSHDLPAAPPGDPGVQADLPAAPDQYRVRRHPHVGGLLRAVRHLHHDHVFRRHALRAGGGRAHGWRLPAADPRAGDDTPGRADDRNRRHHRVPVHVERAAVFPADPAGPGLADAHARHRHDEGGVRPSACRS